MAVVIFRLWNNMLFSRVKICVIGRLGGPYSGKLIQGRKLIGRVYRLRLVCTHELTEDSSIQTFCSINKS